MLDSESRVSMQSISDTEVFSPRTLGNPNVFSYDEGDNQVSRDGRDSPVFLDISNNMQPAAFAEIKSEPDTDNVMSWTKKHPENWTQDEILDWIYLVACTIDVDPATIRGEGFQNITGPELCRMSQEDFQKRDPVNGKCFYDMFRSLHKDAFFSEPPREDKYVYQHADIKQEPGMSPCSYTTGENGLDAENLLTTTKGSDLEVLIGTAWYDIDPCVEIQYGIDKMTRQFFQSQPDYGYGSSDSESHSDSSETMGICHRMYRNDSTGSDVMSDDELSRHSTSSEEDERKLSRKKTPLKKKLTKHGVQKKTQNRGRKPGQISKGNHLWEFIRDLLRNPEYNPNLLKWEEKETGVFRFVQSEAVAVLWGKKKNNRDMTYEKLSRAMRFCRTAGYFAEVPKTGKFPKKLCFRFGAKAFGWKDKITGSFRYYNMLLFWIELTAKNLCIRFK